MYWNHERVVTIVHAYTLFGKELLAPLTLYGYETGHITRSRVKKPTNIIDKFNASTADQKKTCSNTCQVNDHQKRENKQ